jgi:hypothetical protein
MEIALRIFFNACIAMSVAFMYPELRASQFMLVCALFVYYLSNSWKQ